MAQEYFTFDPKIYPRLIWISIGKDSFEDKFEGMDDLDESNDAQCDCVRDKVNDKGGVFIRFSTLEKMTYENITHESLHAALLIFRYVDAYVELNNQEPICYLAGWIAKCCEEVKNKYIK